MGKDWGKANKTDILVGICYGAPSQDGDKEKIFYKWLGEISQLALVLMGDFSLAGSAKNIIQRKGNRLEGSWSMWKRSSCHGLTRSDGLDWDI